MDSPQTRFQSSTRLPSGRPGGTMVFGSLGAMGLFFLLGALTRTGLEQVFFGAAFLVVGLVILLGVTRGTAAHGFARALAGSGGAILLLGALGLGVGSLWLAVGVGGFGILAAAVGVPAAFIVGLWGYTLVKIGFSPAGR